MADKIQGVPDGLTEEPVQNSGQIQGVPADLTAEPVKPQAQPSDRVADSLQNATISPPETGAAAAIDRFKNKVRDWMGADRPAGDMVGGIVLGPINAAHGAAILPSHPVRGAHEILSGVGQTVALPAAVINPATMAYAAPGIVAQKGVSSGLKALGADDDYANLGGDVAGIAAGVGVNSPKIIGTAGAIAKPFVKMATEGIKDTPVIGGLIRGAKTFKDVPGDIGKVWTGKTGDPQLDLFNSTPKLGDSPIFATADKPSLQSGSVRSTPMPDDTTATIAPKTASSPKAAQTSIMKSMGIASPSATLKPMGKIPSAEITPRSDLSFAGSRSGESAAMNQLTENYSPDKLSINDMRGIAQARGIKVSPSDSHTTLINKIHDSLTPEELDKFDQAASERMQPDYSLPSRILPPK
ncbi:MAG TPA: hypothetical protein VGN44_12290 [Candidatus Angelobacter sp.]|jgi:hypothetical protein